MSILPLEIESWLGELSERQLSEVPENDTFYEKGYDDGQTVLAHRILSVSRRIESECTPSI